jgi:hypothetical protein
MDPTLLKGEKVLEESGQPSRRTTVERWVYGPGGEELQHDVFSSSYRSEPKIVRIGTKKPPKKPAETTTTETETTPAITTPTPTTTSTESQPSVD